MEHQIHRRQFLKTTGYLSVGFTLFGCSDVGDDGESGTPEPFAIEYFDDLLPADSHIDAWLQVLEDGRVQILTGKMELGQGLKAVMQQVAGEELNLAPHKIGVVLADTARTPNEGMTSGSRSVERSAMIVRRAAAAAAQSLKKMAAGQMETSPDQLVLEDGLVKHREKELELSFNALLEGKQLSEEIPEDVPLKPKDQYQWVGRPVPHPDLEKIVRGEAVYVQDLRLPGMTHARVLRPPVYGSKLMEWDREVERMPGVLKVVEDGSFLGVIAEE